MFIPFLDPPPGCMLLAWETGFREWHFAGIMPRVPFRATIDALKSLSNYGPISVFFFGKKVFSFLDGKRVTHSMLSCF